MLSLVLATSIALAAEVTPPGVPSVPTPQPVVVATQRPFDLARYRRSTTTARVGLGLSIAGPVLLVVGVVGIFRGHDPVGPAAALLGGGAAMLVGPPMLLGGAQVACDTLQAGGVHVSRDALQVGWVSLALGVVSGLGWPATVVAGAIQLRANERALERALRLSLAPQLLPGGGGLALVVRL